MAPTLQQAAPSPGEEARANVRTFSVGEKVAYWSDTHNVWMEATVMRQHMLDGATKMYDLDIKRNARAVRIRRMASVSVLEGNGEATTVVQQVSSTLAHTPPEAAAAPGGHQTLKSADLVKLPTPVPMPDLESEASIHRFSQGEEVQYWSETYHQWMPATVVRARDGGQSYDLDVKKGANVARIKAAPPRNSEAGLAASPVTVTGGSLLTGHFGATQLGAGGSLSAIPGSFSQGTLDVKAAAEGRRSAMGRKTAFVHSQSFETSARTAVGEVLPARWSRALVVSSPQVNATRVSVAGAVPAGLQVRQSVDGSPSPSGASARPSFFVSGVGMEAKQGTVSSAGIRAERAPSSLSFQGPPPLSQASSSSSSGSSVLSGLHHHVASGALKVGELQISSGAFNPSSAAVRAQLLLKMGLNASGQSWTVEEMQGFRGGLNEGVWFLTSPTQHANGREFVLKLVRGRRLDRNLATEAENFVKIARENPSVCSDPALAFPTWVFSCIGPGGQKQYDLIVMKKAPGERIAEVIARMWYGKQVPQLMRILESLGAFLAKFHARYGQSQHGDFQPSNVLYDKAQDCFSMIDLGGMGVPTTETDVEHFSRSMRLLSEAYGMRMVIDGVRAFEQGYTRGSSSAAAASKF